MHHLIDSQNSAIALFAARSPPLKLYCLGADSPADWYAACNCADFSDFTDHLIQMTDLGTHESARDEIEW